MSTPNPPVYNPNIPLPKNNIAQSQEDFLVDFRTLYNAFARNHVPLDDATDPGDHTFVELFKQNKGPQTDLDEISVYTKTIEENTEQLFIKYPNGTEIPISCYQIYPAQQAGSQISFFTFLPGKVIVYFGTINPAIAEGGNTLYFYPFVMKNLITINFCPIGTVATKNPWVALQNDQGHKDFITAARLNDLPSGFSFSYIAVGNI